MYRWKTTPLVAVNIFAVCCWVFVAILSSRFHLRMPKHIDSYSKRMSQKCYQFFINEKLKKLIYFFICILPNYVPHEIIKDFLKNSHFENMTDGFLLSCQNTLRWNTPEKMHFQQWHFFIFTSISPLIVIVVCIISKWFLLLFFRTIIYPKDNFCFHESIFQWQTKHISHRS